MSEALDLIAIADSIEAVAVSIRAIHARSGRVEDADAVFHLYEAAHSLRRAHRRLAALRAEQAVAAAAAPKQRAWP